MLDSNYNNIHYKLYECISKIFARHTDPHIIDPSIGLPEGFVAFKFDRLLQHPSDQQHSESVPSLERQWSH